MAAKENMSKTYKPLLRRLLHAFVEVTCILAKTNAVLEMLALLWRLLKRMQALAETTAILEMQALLRRLLKIIQALAETTAKTN